MPSEVLAPTTTVNNGPQRVSFKIEPKLAEAVAALRRVHGIDPSENRWIFNFLIRRGLCAWLDDNKVQERPWAAIAAWFEANPEAEELTDDGMDWGNPVASAIQEYGYWTDQTDDWDIYTVDRERAERLLAKERAEIDGVLEAHRTIRHLLNAGWRYRELETEEAAQ
jgi:hypothetical protein